MRFHSVGCIVSLFALLCFLQRFGEGSPMREWTVMVYLNGANDLENEALCEFRQLASVGSNAKLAIVAELARPNALHLPNIVCDDGIVPVKPWSGVRRYFVTESTQLDQPIVGRNLGEIDLRTKEALRDFVRWASIHFPAQHYSLILWDHGTESPRLVEALRMQASQVRNPAVATPCSPHQAFDSPFRSVYRDSDGDHLLLNSDVRSAIREAIGTRKLDIIEFDACLKAMLETAYAMKDIAKVMVASEDTAEKGGWNYKGWLTQLKNAPNLTRRAVARLVVRSYVAGHKDDETNQVTESAIDLTLIEKFAAHLDEFINAVTQNSDATAKLATARATLTQTFECMKGVDLNQFLVSYEATGLDSDTHATELRLQTDLMHLVIESYGNYRSRTRYGSNGLSVYFPASPGDYQSDVDCVGYDPGSQCEIEFAKRHSWFDLLKASWGLTPKLQCEISHC